MECPHAKNESVGTREIHVEDPHNQRGFGEEHVEGNSIMTTSVKGSTVAVNGRFVVGIDIGKQKHAAAAITPQGEDVGPSILFQNTKAGINCLQKQILETLGKPEALIIAMEATGHYWMPLYFALTRRGYQIAVINPIQTRVKFRSRIRKAKNDKIDARSIARMTLSGDAKSARIPDESTLELRMLTRQRWRLIDMTSDLSRFAQTLVDRVFPEYAEIFSKPFLPSGRALIQDIGLDPEVIVARAGEVDELLKRCGRKKIQPEKIKFLIEQAENSIGIHRAEGVIVKQLQSTLNLMESVETQVKEIDDELKRRVQEMNSPVASLGIKEPLIATIHAESDPITDFAHPWQYAAYAGLDPSTYNSGNFIGSKNHISKRGSPFLRRALYLAAFATYKRHTDLLRRYKKARKAGHSHNDALVIVAHKLARIIWRLITDNRPFKARPPIRK